MTGRDLIMYILSHNLEDEPIIQDGVLVGFTTVEKAAEKMGVGNATIFALIQRGQLEAISLANYMISTDCDCLEV